MLGDQKPGEKPFKDEGYIDGIFFCELCGCHYLSVCPSHLSDSSTKVNWYDKKTKEKKP